MESTNSHIPKTSKKMHWTEKHCMLCKKHGGLHKNQNTHGCYSFDTDSTPIKKNGRASMPQPRVKTCDGVNFAQIVWVGFKKVLHKQFHKC